MNMRAHNKNNSRTNLPSSPTMSSNDFPYGHPNAGNGLSNPGQGYHAASAPTIDPSATARSAYTVSVAVAASALSASAAAASSTAYATTAVTFSDDDEMMPWEEDGWVPTTKSGKQKTPNVVSMMALYFPRRLPCVAKFVV